MAHVSLSASGISRWNSSFALNLGVLCLLGFVALNAGLLWRVRHSIFEGYGDFASFYTAGQIVRSGQSPRLYDPALQWKVQQQFASTVKIRLGPLPYIRPPFEALLFLPLAYLPYPAACVVWMAIKIVLLLAVPFLLPRLGPEGSSIATCFGEFLLCLAFFPVAFDLVQGQDSILLLLVLILAFKLLLRGVYGWCGAVLALGMFKFHLVIPLLAIFALRKQLRVVLGFLAMGFPLFGISLAMVHWSGVFAYPKYLWRLNQAPGLGMVKPQSMPNVRGLTTVLLGNGPLSVTAQWLLGGIVVLGTIMASRSWRGDDKKSIAAAFSCAIVVTLATSYYANAYDLTLLLLPLLILGKTIWRGSEISGWPRLLFLAAAAVLLFTPLSWALALLVDQFRWMGIVVLALAVSIVAGERYWRRRFPAGSLIGLAWLSLAVR